MPPPDTDSLEVAGLTRDLPAVVDVGGHRRGLAHGVELGHHPVTPPDRMTVSDTDHLTPVVDRLRAPRFSVLPPQT
jgi:hypothetical protein